MGAELTAISDDLKAFIERQTLFFVATAPLAIDDRINLSPKGYGGLKVLGPNQVAYLDLTGSGNETAAHLRENGRITILLCSFEETPLLVRLYGQGRMIRPDEPDWDRLAPGFELLPGARQIMLMEVAAVTTSCGYMTPVIEKARARRDLIDWAEQMGPDGLRQYRDANNIVSIDGLPTGLKDPAPGFE